VLFDLRSGRRRRVVQIVFGGLAALFAISFVGFGIGSDVSGGIFDALGLTDNSGNADVESQVDEAEQRVEENPRNPQALADLVQVYVQAGNQQAEGVDANGVIVLSSESEESFNKAADTWDRYLKLDPKKPDDAVALQLAGAFFLLAQNADSAADAVSALTVAADAQAVAADANPSVGNLRFLAIYQYFAGQLAAGDRTVDRLVAESSPGRAEAIRKQFEAIRKQGEALQKQVKAESKGGGGGGNPLGQGGGALGGGLGSGSGLGG
jgi:hypothetical protein